MASIFLAVTVVLLPVRAGEDYSGSWAARLQPGRLFLSFAAVLTSFGRAGVQSLMLMPNQLYHIYLLHAIHLFYYFYLIHRAYPLGLPSPTAAPVPIAVALPLISRTYTE
jgi:hypothetical protein